MRLIMIKNSLFAAALLSLALAVSCAKGGNGIGSGITVTVGDNNVSIIYPTQTITFTATVKPPTTSQTVTWSLSGTGCSGSGNPCGTIDPNSGVYTAPAVPPTPVTLNITATSTADTTATGNLQVAIRLIQVVVTPSSVTVGDNGLEQQFTAIATPDDVKQSFTWNVTCTSSPCGQVVQDSNTSGLAVYTSGSNQAVQVSATSTVNDGSLASASAKVSVVSSRLVANSTYGFQFSGYDTANKPIAAIGTVTTSANGAIAGVEDVLTNTGYQQLSINSGSYAPSANNPNSNNLGTLTLNLSNGVTNKYTAVLTASGSIQMIESDGLGTGSGVMQKAAPIQFNAGGQTFAFGFSGSDPGGSRVGYVGMLPMVPSGTGGTITGGLLDSNNNGSNTGSCGAPPCTVAGSYQQDATFVNLWHLTLTTGVTQHFDFVLGGGQTQTKTGPNSLTLFAISTDPVDATHPEVSGTMVYQVPGTTYNNATFNGASISTLTGASANVALINGVTDGGSSGTGGTGSFFGNFDQNNNGTVLSVANFPASGQSPTPYTYVSTNGNSGRYIFQMLGNPNASPVVAPIPFVLYASGANRGFLLDQSSTAVLTGAMYPQPAKASGSYSPAGMPGTYAVATSSNSSPSVAPLVQNLVLTSPGGGVFNLAGAQNPGNVTLAGTYSMELTGTGAITLTAPAASKYVIGAIDFDATISAVTDFFIMGADSGTPSALMFAQQ